MKKKPNNQKATDDLRPEYDFSALKTAYAANILGASEPERI